MSCCHRPCCAAGSALCWLRYRSTAAFTPQRGSCKRHRKPMMQTRRNGDHRSECISYRWRVACLGTRVSSLPITSPGGTQLPHPPLEKRPYQACQHLGVTTALGRESTAAEKRQRQRQQESCSNGKDRGKKSAYLFAAAISAHHSTLRGWKGPLENPRKHQRKCDQQDARSDPSPLLCSWETPPRVLRSVPVFPA